MTALAFGSVRRLARALAAVALVALALVVSWDVRSWQRLGDETDLVDAREEAAEAARAAVPEMLSYRKATLEDDLRRARSWLTDRFAPEFTELQDRLIEPTVGHRFSTVAVVDRVAVTEGDGDEVSLLVFVEQTTRQGRQQQAEPVSTRATVRMRLVDGDWLVDDLRPA